MSQNISTVSVIGFFSLFMLLTLNAENGKDMLDVTVEHIMSETQLNKKELTRE